MCLEKIYFTTNLWQIVTFFPQNKKTKKINTQKFQIEKLAPFT